MEMGGTPIFFSPILAILKNFKCFDFSGGQQIFFLAKVPQKWSSFFKKIHSSTDHYLDGWMETF